MKINPRLKEELKAYLKNRLRHDPRQVVIVSSYKLNGKELDNIKNEIAVLKNAQVVNEVDPSLMAGIILRFDSKMIDLSLGGELFQLQKRIHEST